MPGITLLFLLLIAPLAERPRPDSVVRGRDSEAQQPNTDRQKDSAESPENGRFVREWLKRDEQREKQSTASDSEKVAEEKSNNSKTFWLLFGTVLGTWALVLVGMKQAKIARDTAKRQLRAYIGVDGAEPGSINEIARFRIENFGQTPALKVQISTSWDIETLEKVDFATFVATQEGEFVIDPGAHIHSRITVNDEWKKRSGDLWSPGMVLWFVGRIDYEDVFGTPHWREFRLMGCDPIPFVGDDGQRYIQHSYQICDDGNKADTN